MEESNRKVKSPELKKEFTILDLELVHTVNGNGYSLPFVRESNGTRRYYGFAGLLALIL